MVPDLTNNRRLVYVGSSSGSCTNFDIVVIPLSNPAGAKLLKKIPTTGHPCHDIGLILGSAMKLACAGGNSMGIYSLGRPDRRLARGADDDAPHRAQDSGRDATAGLVAEDEDLAVPAPRGGLADRPPAIRRPSRTTARSSRDRELHAAQPEHDPAEERSGRARARQLPVGTSVVDFTNPANPVELAWSDPPPIVPTDIGGAWSSYWYNDYIYETNITEGLNVFEYTGPQVKGNFTLNYLNPQTQEFTIKAKGGKKRS